MGGIQKKKEDLINRDYLVQVPQQKGGKIVWTCVEDNSIKEKEDNRDIVIYGVNYTLFEEK